MKSHKKYVKMHEVQHEKKMKRKRKVSCSSAFHDSLDQRENKKMKTNQMSSSGEVRVSADAGDIEKRKFEKEARNVRKLQLQQAIREEDKVISRLEKALGMKKRRRKKKNPKKIPPVFVRDGLDYILEVVNEPDNIMEEEETDLDEDLPLQLGRKDSKSFFADDRKSSDKKMEGQFESEEDDVSSENGSNSGIHSVDKREMSDDSNVDNESDNNSQDVDLELQSTQKSKSEEQKPKIWEDIYGRLRDDKGNILPNSSQANQLYVPPHERMKQEPIDDKRKATLVRIKRHLKGLINRLSESNIKPVSSEIEEMYMKNSRNDMNETLLSILSDVLVSPESVPPRFALEQAMLIALLHGNIGEEIGAFFLQNLALKLDEHLKAARSGAQGKECYNVLIFLCHLYNFQVTHSLLIFDILRLYVESFQEIDIELIFLILKHSGFTLRKDNPLALKDVLLSIHSKASSLKPEQDKSRVKFMLDVLAEVRNNNMHKMKKLLNYDPSITEQLKKVLRGLVRKGSYIQELSISYADLLKAHERGRWWIVGSAWSARTSENTADVKNDSGPMLENSLSDKILRLAKMYHFNTEIRRAVFGIIMTAENYLCAFERLLRLKLKRNQQEKEIISLLLFCCLQERTFNIYYVYVISHFCKYNRRFRGYLKFSLWDKFRELENLTAIKRNNLASLLVNLFTTESIDISVLKVIPFSEMNQTMAQFFRKILTPILLHEEEDMCRKVFQRVASNSNLNMLRESLRLFMHLFILRRKARVDPSVAEKLKQRVKIAEDTLNSAKHAFKL